MSAPSTPRSQIISRSSVTPPPAPRNRIRTASETEEENAFISLIRLPVPLLSTPPPVIRNTIDLSINILSEVPVIPSGISSESGLPLSPIRPFRLPSFLNYESDEEESDEEESDEETLSFPLIKRPRYIN